ncbi:MAG TPA: hypothetical protein VGN12_06975 [Pirellulales bacterium]
MNAAIERLQRRSLRSPCFACLLLTIIVGCGRSDTVSMSGTVSLDGQPVKVGVITLEPFEARQAPSTGAAIENGAFSIVRDKGPKRGVSYRVEISAIDRTNLEVWQVAKEQIPDKYNRFTELSVSVPPEAGNFTQDFVLTRDKPKKR